MAPTSVASERGTSRFSSFASLQQRGYGPEISILATYPPTACGIATFAAALSAGLEAHGARVNVARIADDSGPGDRRVIAELVPGSAGSLRTAAAVLNRADIAIVQHEYGIYGGPDGAELLELLGLVDSPPIVVAHTVLREPTEHQRLVLEEVADAAGTLVVMSEWARRTLIDGFDVDGEKVQVIPHGARFRMGDTTRGEFHDADPLLVTWGLLGPGKGIEWVLEALDALNDYGVSARYLIAGQTHPKVLAREGESYRRMLERRVIELGLTDQVSFDDTYRSMERLDELIDQATMVILPYDSLDQVTSGVLVDAIASGCPVVSTPFPHAVELLQSGAGVIVPRKDPWALADELHRLLTDDAALLSLASEARRVAPTLSWDAVAASYLALDPVRSSCAATG
jgi:glycosyltransferase involved in cell wall biosynthesis